MRKERGCSEDVYKLSKRLPPALLLIAVLIHPCPKTIVVFLNIMLLEACLFMDARFWGYIGSTVVLENWEENESVPAYHSVYQINLMSWMVPITVFLATSIKSMTSHFSIQSKKITCSKKIYSPFGARRICEILTSSIAQKWKQYFEELSTSCIYAPNHDDGKDKWCSIKMIC